MITEKNIQCFLSLANTLNFTQTANDLFLSQQAVSKNIAAIEQSLETTLFKRDHHNVQLTDAGRQYYELFFHFSNELREKKAAMNGTGLFSAHPLRVGFQQYLNFSEIIHGANMKMRERLPDFLPTITRLSPNELINSLIDDKVDVIIIYERFAGRIPRCISARLGEIPNFLMVSRTHPAAAESADYRAFKNMPFICDSVEETGKTGGSLRKARAYVEEIGMTPSRIIIADNRETAYTATEQGLGYIITTKLCYYNTSPLLLSFPVPLKDTMLAVWKKNFPDQELVREYAHALQKRMSAP